MDKNISKNKFLLKTKWAPLFLFLVAILVSVYFNIQNKNKEEELEKKIFENEKTIDTLRVEISKLRKETMLIR